MKKPGQTFWFIVAVVILGIFQCDNLLYAGGPGKHKGWGKAKKEKGEKFKYGAHGGNTRVYSLPPVGSIQSSARKYRYVYYPDIAMYYNRDNDRYFWLQGSDWVSGHEMPDWARVKYLPRVELELPYLTPYSDHTWIVESFPAAPEVSGFVMKPGKGKGPPDHAPAWGYRRKYNYFYYPQANVYYNIDTKRYFWIDGGDWRFGIEIPSGVILDEGSRTKLVLGSPWPY